MQRYDPGASAVAGDLLAVLGPERVVIDPDVIDAFRRDQALMVPAGHPLAVVRARSVDDVVETLRWASARHAPVVTRGAGTGLAGGANAIDGCVVLSTQNMNEIVGVNPAQRSARVQCGVINGDLAAAAATHGLCYPPDPSSRSTCTIGGNIATNAGGACCLLYGVTGDHVAELTAVLADGTVIHTGALTRNNVAGFDLTRLLIGSEGTLAVIVEAAVRLVPAPAKSATLMAFFTSLDAAARAIAGMQAGVRTSLRASRSYLRGCGDGSRRRRDVHGCSASGITRAGTHWFDRTRRRRSSNHSDPGAGRADRDHRGRSWRGRRNFRPRRRRQSASDRALRSERWLVSSRRDGSVRRGGPRRAPLRWLDNGRARNWRAENGVLMRHDRRRRARPDAPRIKRAFDPDGILNPGRAI